MAGILCRLLDSGAPAQDDQVGKGNLLAPGLGAVEGLLDALQGVQNRRQLHRLVHFPILLRGEANARAVGPATLVRAAEGGCRRPCRGD